MTSSAAVRSFFALTFLASASLFAAPIATETFESYGLGELNGGNGGSGWGGAWSADTAATQVVTPAPVLDGTRSLLLTGNNDNVAHRQLSAAVSSTEVFFSFAFRVNAGSIDVNDFMAFWFDNVATGSHTGVPNIGYKSNLGAGSADLFSRLLLGSEVYDTNIVVGEDHRIVGRLYKDGSSNYNRFELWIDPVSQASPSVTATSAGAISSFNRIGIRTANLDAGDQLLVGDVRLGTTFEDVAPVPEPSSLVLLGSALAGVGLLRKRRQSRV